MSGDSIPPPPERRTSRTACRILSSALAKTHKMSDHGVVKQGYVRQRSKKLGGVWQKRWLVLRKCPNMGPPRLESYTSEMDWRKYSTDMDSGRHRSYLGSCRKSKVYLLDQRQPKGGAISVSRLPSSIRKFSFCVCFQTSNSENNHNHSDILVEGRQTRRDGKIKTFACESNYDADAWVKAIQAEAGQLSESGEGILLGGAPDVVASSLRKEMLNDTFRVFLVSTTALDACGDCLLQVAPENLYVYSMHEPRERLAAWPLTALRRYGSDSEKFTFEAGRHCATGEGLFVFYGPHSESIYQRVHQATLAIAAQANAMEPTAPQYERRPSIGSSPRPNFNELRHSLEEDLNSSFIASTTTSHFATSGGVVKSTQNPISFRSHLLSLSTPSGLE